MHTLPKIVAESDVERLVLEAYAEAGLDPEEPPGPHELAQRLGVEVRYDSRQLLGASRGNYDRWRDVVYLRPGLSSPEEAWVLAHELGHRILIRAGQAHREADADRCGLELLVPLPARECREGGDWNTLEGYLPPEQIAEINALAAG